MKRYLKILLITLLLPTATAGQEHYFRISGHIPGDRLVFQLTDSSDMGVKTYSANSYGNIHTDSIGDNMFIRLGVLSFGGDTLRARLSRCIAEIQTGNQLCSFHITDSKLGPELIRALHMAPNAIIHIRRINMYFGNWLLKVERPEISIFFNNNQ